MKGVSGCEVYGKKRVGYGGCRGDWQGNRYGKDRLGYGNANLICFLASDEASYIAGQNIQIDGCRKKQ
ncbi:MAG: hypothetical protein IJX62_03400 [Clostridia bacterium]|nr:hypothetical protein [Clostridia bacterium]